MLICQVKKNQYQKKLKWMRLLLSFWLLFLSEITHVYFTEIVHWFNACYIIRYIRLFLGLVWPEPKYFLKSLNEIRRICLLSTSTNQWIWSPKPHFFFKPLSNSVTDLPIRSCTWLNPYILEINFLPIRSAEIRPDGALVILYLSHYC